MSSMDNGPCKHEGAKVLLVEGTNDCHVVLNLCGSHGLPETFGVYECGSDTSVLRRLNALILSTVRPDVIGVMLDADNPSLEGRWESIKGKLGHHPYEMPVAPPREGSIIDGDADKPRLGFWLMPDNETSGMLEDFCARLAEPNTFAFAQQCVEDVRRQDLGTFKEVHLSKATVHTYLAWQDEPGRPLGQAISSQTLRPDTEIAVRFTNWLRTLFV